MLTINPKKTKIIIFQKWDSRFYISNEKIDLLQNYTYLGTWISSLISLSLDHLFKFSPIVAPLVESYVRCGSQLTRNREGTFKTAFFLDLRSIKTFGILRWFHWQRGRQLRSSSRFSTSFSSWKFKVSANVVDLHKTSLSNQIFKITPSYDAIMKTISNAVYCLTLLPHHATGQRLSPQP